MSIWGDIRKRSEGSTIRQEDLPPVQKTKPKEVVIIEKKEEKSMLDIMIIVTRVIASFVLACIFTVFTGSAVSMIAGINLMGEITFIFTPILAIVNYHLMNYLIDDI